MFFSHMKIKTFATTAQIKVFILDALCFLRQCSLQYHIARNRTGCVTDVTTATCLAYGCGNNAGNCATESFLMGKVTQKRKKNKVIP